MKTLIILTAPPSSGMTTVGKLFAKKRTNSVRIDVEPFQWMILHPHKVPWEDLEGLKKQLRIVQNACFLAKGFLGDGRNVVIQDLLTQETAQKYRASLQAYSPVIVQLLPSLEKILDLENKRGPILTKEEIIVLHEQQKGFSDFDQRIDNTNLSSQQVVRMLEQHLTQDISY